MKHDASDLDAHAQVSGPSPLGGSRSGRGPVFVGGAPFDLLRGGAPIGGLIIRSVELFLAVDRPDRLEVRYSLSRCVRGREAEPEVLFDRGCRLQARLGGRTSFDGSVERTSAGFDARDGAWCSFVAYAHYQELRARVPEGPYVQVTDSALAGEIARSLGLVPRVEPTTAIHDRIRIAGDPLRFLRRRARACGFELALRPGRLHFQRHLPDRGPTVVRRGPSGLSSVLVRREGARRSGWLAGPLRAEIEPAGTIELMGFGPGSEGRYRVLRVEHTCPGAGWRTRVEFLEGGLDPGGTKTEDENRDVRTEEVSHGS